MKRFAAFLLGLLFGILLVYFAFQNTSRSKKTVRELEEQIERQQAQIEEIKATYTVHPE